MFKLILGQDNNKKENDTNNDSFHSCAGNLETIEKKCKNNSDKSKIFKGYLLFDQKYKEQCRANLRKALDKEENQQPQLTQEELERQELEKERMQEQISRKCLELFNKGNKMKEDRDRRITEQREQQREREISEAQLLKDKLRNKIVRSVPKLSLEKVDSANVQQRTHSSPTKALTKTTLNLMKDRLVSSLTQRIELKSRGDIVNIETERPQNNFMKDTEAKQCQQMDKVDQLDSISKSIYEKQENKGTEFVKKNKETLHSSNFVKKKLEKIKEKESSLEKKSKKNNSNVLARQFKEDQERLVSFIIQRRNQPKVNGEIHDSFSHEIRYTSDDNSVLSDEFKKSNLTQTEFNQVLYSLHFLLNEEDRIHAYHIFSLIKRDPALECTHRKDLLNILLFIQGYKRFSELKLYSEDTVISEHDKTWKVLRNNRISSVKKHTNVETYSFKPKVNNNYKIESLKPEDRCWKWNEAKKESIEKAKQERSKAMKEKENEFVNHKLKINKNILRGSVNTKVQEYITQSKIRRATIDEKNRAMSLQSLQPCSSSSTFKSSAQKGSSATSQSNQSKVNSLSKKYTYKYTPKSNTKGNGSGTKTEDSDKLYNQVVDSGNISTSDKEKVDKEAIQISNGSKISTPGKNKLSFETYYQAEIESKMGVSLNKDNMSNGTDNNFAHQIDDLEDIEHFKI